MRVLIFAAAAMLAACSTPTPDIIGEARPNPFPVERGSAIPPPTPANARQSAPPEGASPGGIDFGQWRGADPAAYAPAFQAQMRARFANQEISAIRADLERNGFACEQSGQLECRIEIMERDCAIDWYVVVERARAEPIAGYDVMCLGAR
jgi:hypothetical protein